MKKLILGILFLLISEYLFYNVPGSGLAGPALFFLALVPFLGSLVILFIHSWQLGIIFVIFSFSKILFTDLFASKLNNPSLFFLFSALVLILYIFLYLNKPTRKMLYLLSLIVGILLYGGVCFYIGK